MSILRALLVSSEGLPCLGGSGGALRIGREVLSARDTREARGRVRDATARRVTSIGAR